MIQGRSILLLLAMATPASAETISFESAASMLGASCGQDIDANCLGVNLDPVRLKECLARNGDVVSPQCKADYPRAFEAIQKRVAARVAVGKACERDKPKYCGDPQSGPAGFPDCLLKTRGVSV